MNYLLDTHLLLWSLYRPSLVPRKAVLLLEPASTVACFSVVSLIEIAIKQQTGKLDLSVNLAEARDELFRNRYTELQIKAAHAIALSDLPLLHKDPFDRLLAAQASAEGLTLLTADRKLADYGAMVLLVQ